MRTVSNGCGSPAACGGLRRGGRAHGTLVTVAGLTEPVDAGLSRALRAAALELRDRRRTRRFPPEVSVGGLGRPRALREAVVELDADRLDHTLRCELVAALLARALPDEQHPVAWLARPGPLAWHDLDAAWWPAFAAAYAEAAVPLTAVVVTRHGWYDPRSGLAREWRRLRHRGRPRGG